MKIVSITELRQDATRVVQQAQRPGGDVVLIVQRSKPAAYILGAAHYEELQAELRQLRRAELLRDVAEAEQEVRRGGLKAYDDIDEMMRDLDLEETTDAGDHSRLSV
ncbi:MAG TPA: type II toxin-antitoxin system prevent-host-death family antitoxin [Chloroflexota bacterium]|nr:type II toxin-antitoxin system prevent-host-death family antitoxin [Chloroflexota bacterium]